MATITNISGHDLFVPEVDRAVPAGESVEVVDAEAYTNQTGIWAAVIPPESSAPATTDTPAAPAEQ